MLEKTNSTSLHVDPVTGYEAESRNVYLGEEAIG